MEKLRQLFEAELEKSERNLVGIDEESLTMMDLFRKYFDLWTVRLFPLWELEGYRVYDRLSEILTDNGREVSAKTISVYLNRVRSERNMHKLRKRGNK